MDFATYSEARLKLVEHYIAGSLSQYQGKVSQRFRPLIEAMRYSIEGGGKRLRPLLVMASAEYLGLEVERVLPAACAVEYIHTYSLIHDDLPSIDDDDTRRGKPSSHKQFGEAVAILAGDALLTEAFGQMARLEENGRFGPKDVISALQTLVHYAGVGGLVGGQLLDVSTDVEDNLPELEFIHIHKTGALILCSVLLPARLLRVDESNIQRLRRYGEAIGLAFQISDDILDAASSIRYSRGPRKKPKPSYAKQMGINEARARVNSLVDSAIQVVSDKGERAKPLIAIADFIRSRKN